MASDWPAVREAKTNRSQWKEPQVESERETGSGRFLNEIMASVKVNEVAN